MTSTNPSTLPTPREAPPDAPRHGEGGIKPLERVKERIATGARLIAIWTSQDAREYVLVEQRDHRWKAVLSIPIEATRGRYGTESERARTEHGPFLSVDQAYASACTLADRWMARLHEAGRSA